VCFLLILLHSAPLVETCETKSVAFTQCGPGTLCICAGRQDQECLMAQTIPQLPPETSTPFSSHSPAVPDTLMVVARSSSLSQARVHARSWQQTECALSSRNLAPACTARYQSYARYDQSLLKCPRERNWQGKVFNRCYITVVINNKKQSLWPNGYGASCQSCSIKLPHGFDPTLERDFRVSRGRPREMAPAHPRLFGKLLYQ
jgi:hypothetical protein